MAVNKVRRFVNLSKNLDTSGDVATDGIEFNLDLGIPSITSIHPTDNLSSGDLIFLVGTDFDASANVTLISNTGVRTVAGNVTFNSTSNVTFTWPLGGGSADLNPYDVKLELVNKGVAGSILDSANGLSFSPVQGTISGYTSGGINPGSSPSPLNVIDKFPFASDANATDVGDLTVNTYYAAGQSSDESGYNSGGLAPTLTPQYINVISKFPFASDGNATDVGDLTASRRSPAGQSSNASGYSSGGQNPAQSPNTLNAIDKFPFASDGNATDVGDLTVARYSQAGQSSSASGYTSGGYGPAQSDVIDKFPFASDGNATDVGDLTVGRFVMAGQSSTVSGYTSGGGAAGVGVIDKFPFASDGNATDVGDLTVSGGGQAGQSSDASGYASGALYGSPLTYSNIIEKFPFASDANATDVGDLTVARSYPAGQQV